MTRTIQVGPTDAPLGSTASWFMPGVDTDDDDDADADADDDDDDDDDDDGDANNNENVPAVQTRTSDAACLLHVWC